MFIAAKFKSLWPAWITAKKDKSSMSMQPEPKDNIASVVESMMHDNIVTTTRKHHRIIVTLKSFAQL
jgi:hypothetical protein